MAEPERPLDAPGGPAPTPAPAPAPMPAPAPAPTPGPARDADWACTFEAAELEQLRRSARLSFAEKLAWLEEVDRLGRAFEASRRAADRGPAAADTPRAADEAPPCP